jgi:hypothetical protein
MDFVIVLYRLLRMWASKKPTTGIPVIQVLGDVFAARLSLWLWSDEARRNLARR